MRRRRNRKKFKSIYSKDISLFFSFSIFSLNSYSAYPVIVKVLCLSVSVALIKFTALVVMEAMRLYCLVVGRINQRGKIRYCTLLLDLQLILLILQCILD